MRPRYCLLLLLATIFAAACIPGPVAPPAPNDPTATSGDVRTAELRKGFITVDVTLPPDRPGPRPVVLAPTIDRDALLAAGFALAEYRVRWDRLSKLRPAPAPATAPAPAPAARTVGKWLLASPSAATVGQGYFRFIDGDATKTIPDVLDYLATLPEIDSGRVGISGNSTLGFTALQAIAADPRIGVAAIANACGDYHAFLADSTLGLSGAEPLALDAEYDAWLTAREPITHPERFPPRPLLLVNGDVDEVIPLTCIRPTVHTLRHAYEHAGVPDRFRSAVLPGEGHRVGPDTTAEILAWLVRWLAP